jgi:hypothetical protein
MAPERLLSDRPDNVSVEWPSSPVLEGSYVRLSCKGSANPQVDRYAWYRSRLNPGTDQGPSEGPLGFSRSINVLVSADAQYFCEVGNLYGAKNTSLTQMVVNYLGVKGTLCLFSLSILRNGMRQNYSQGLTNSTRMGDLTSCKKVSTFGGCAQLCASNRLLMHAVIWSLSLHQ